MCALFMTMDNNPVPATIPTRLIHWAKQQPQRYTHIFRSPSIGRMTLSRGEVKDMAFAVAARLSKVGIGIGDVVCNTLQNSPERVVTDLGMLALGAVLVDKRAFRNDLTDMVHILNQSQARLIIVDPGEKNEDGSPTAWEAIRSKCSHVSDVDATNCVTVTWPGMEHAQRVMFCSRGETGKEFEFLKSLDTSSQTISMMEEKSRASVEPSSLAVLFPTSGTTGLSKLSTFTHCCILDGAENWQSLFKLQDHDIMFQDRPMGWLAAFHYAYLSTGNTRVLTDGRTQSPESCPESIWTSIAEEGVTFAHLTPQMASKLASRPDLIGRHGVKLNHLLMAGQPLKKQLLTQVLGTITKTIHNAFGSSEASYLTTEHFIKEDQFEDFVVGYPHPWAEIRVVDNDLNPVNIGVTGEVLVRNRGQFQGYYRDEEKTQKMILPGGWLRTDDAGFLDSKHKLHMLGRRSDAIMRGVVIVYPSEIERHLVEIPGVQDAMVVSVPDPELYHEICGCFVLAPGGNMTCEALEKQCCDVSERWQNEVPVPKYFLIFDAFPTTVTGKTSRSLLRKEACERLGLKP